MKKVLFVISTLFACLCALLYFGNVKAEESNTIDLANVNCFLQQQESENLKSIRYVSTIVGVENTDISDIVVTLTLDQTTEKTLHLDCVYESVNGAVGAKNKTLYSVFTLTDIDMYNNHKLSVRFKYVLSGDIVVGSTHNETYDIYTNSVQRVLGTTYTHYLQTTNQLSTGSKAGNSVYYTTTRREIYLSTDTITSVTLNKFTDGLTMIDNSGNRALIFNTSGGDKFSSVNHGICATSHITGYDSQVLISYKINTSDIAYEDVEGVRNYKVTIDPNYSDYPGLDASTGRTTFYKFSQVMDYARNIIDTTIPYSIDVLVKNGTYKEKLEFDVPYMTFRAENANQATIVFDAVYGLSDIGGHLTHVTDSTATVAVRADFVKLVGLVVENEYKTIDAFDKIPAYKGKGERAVALLVQGDCFTAENCTINGWQDTIELFQGRQYFKQCKVTGCIDYIFGTNSTSYFYDCDIVTIKGKTGSTSDKTNAYVTAFKGNNGDASSKVERGVIFNACRFTAEDDYVGKVALARPWDVNSSVIFFRSYVSNEYIDGTYARINTVDTISNGLISDVNVSSLNIKFYEMKWRDSSSTVTVTINNELDNVNTSLSGSLSQYTQVANYFKESDGTVKYPFAWDGTSVVRSTSYSFVGVSNLATAYPSIDFSGATLRNNSNSYQFSAGTITFTVKANSIVNVVAYESSNYALFSINGVETAAQSLALYFSEETNIVIESTGGNCYITAIEVYENVTSYTVPSLSSLIVSGYPTDEIEKDEDLDLSGLVVTGIYSNGAKKLLSSTEYTVDTTQVDKTTAGEYNVTVKSGAVEQTFKVTYTATVNPNVTKDTTIVFSSTNNASLAAVTGTSAVSGTTVKYGKFTFDATGGKFTLRSSDIMMNAGSKITFTVIAGSSVTVVAHDANYAKLYTINGVGTTAATFTQYYAEETTITILATAQTYLKSLTVDVDATAPAEATVTSLDVSGYPQTDLALNAELNLSSLVVKANYSDNSVVTLTASEYTIDKSKVKPAEAGTYAVTVSFGGKNSSFDVKYVGVVDNTVSTDITWSFNDDTANASDNYFVWDSSTLTTWKKLTFTNPDGGIYNNGAYLGFKNVSSVISFETSAQFGAVLSINYYSNESATVKLDGVEVTGTYVGTSNGYVYKYVLDGTGVVTITATKNQNYLNYIKFEANKAVTSNSYLDFGTGKLAGLKSTYGVFESDGASIGNSNFTQIVSGTLSFRVLAGATVTVIPYDSGNGYLTVNGVENNSQVYSITFNANTIVAIGASSKGNSYIRAVSVVYDGNETTITFGTSGNYGTSIYVCQPGGTSIGGSNTNNSQVKGDIYVFVKAGAKIKVYGYGGSTGTTKNDHTNYTVTANGSTSDAQTGDYEVTVTSDGYIVISGGSDNYFMSIVITYPEE